METSLPPHSPETAGDAAAAAGTIHHLTIVLESTAISRCSGEPPLLPIHSARMDGGPRAETLCAGVEKAESKAVFTARTESAQSGERERWAQGSGRASRCRLMLVVISNFQKVNY